MHNIRIVAFGICYTNQAKGYDYVDQSTSHGPLAVYKVWYVIEKSFGRLTSSPGIVSQKIARRLELEGVAQSWGYYFS